ncbi:MAG: DNA repair protein RadA [Deltaproteobacteria bacterium]|nr:DNA repair protein RadA [Deltaproteobacteria bacterium]
MSKEKVFFTCQNCGYQTPKWMGKCPECTKWHSLIEEKTVEVKPSHKHRSFHDEQSLIQNIQDIECDQTKRLQTKLKEFDRVLGGGIVEGSLTLIGGDPGIGKSTLVLQALNALSRQKCRVLYVSGEESLEQTKLRAQRIGANETTLFVLAETLLEKIMSAIETSKPKVIAIDSVQTVYTSEIESAPGSVSQVREVVIRLMYLAKKRGIAAYVIGHVTKDGAIAGPRVLEHMVDTVLYFEGDGSQSYRILRAVKNRFGSTNEIGVFEMRESGLEGVDNPSELFLSERPLKTPGSVVVSAIEGTRPLLVELQALVTPTTLALPRRTSIGVDANRVSLLVAVLDKKAGMSLFNQDIYVNVAGGLRIQEPAVDLGIIAVVSSSYLNKEIHPKLLCVGEVGLTGEIRAVSHMEARVQEASRLGFEQMLLPASNLKKMKFKSPIDLCPISNLDEMMDKLFQ